MSGYVCPPDHKHGETASCHNLHGCRCTDCVDTLRAYARRRRELIREGRWQPLHDATPAKEHIDQLRAAGMSLADIGKASGADQTTIEEIASGDRKRSSRRVIDKITAARLLPLGERGKVPTEHAARRLEALVALGWPLTWIGNAIGHKRVTLRVILNRRWPFVDGWMFRKIDAFYRAHQVPPVVTERYDRTVITLARNTARKNGWLVPAAWDDIDNLAERPNLTVLRTRASSDLDPGRGLGEKDIECERCGATIPNRWRHTMCRDCRDVEAA